MFNLDLVTLEQILIEDSYSKDKIIIVDLFWNNNSYVLKGKLFQDGMKTISLDISWYDLEKVNLEAMQVMMKSAIDLNITLIEFLQSRGFKTHDVNQIND